MRITLALVVVAALCGCRSTFHSPVGISANPLSIQSKRQSIEPTMAPELKDLKVSIDHGNLVFRANLVLNGFAIDEFAPGDASTPLYSGPKRWVLSVDVVTPDGNTIYRVSTFSPTEGVIRVVQSGQEIGRAPLRLAKNQLRLEVPLEPLGNGKRWGYAVYLMARSDGIPDGNYTRNIYDGLVPESTTLDKLRVRAIRGNLVFDADVELGYNTLDQFNASNIPGAWRAYITIYPETDAHDNVNYALRYDSAIVVDGPLSTGGTSLVTADHFHMSIPLSALSNDDGGRLLCAPVGYQSRL